MNRRPDAADPLSPEERDLAERLLRLGPNDGPSPALDAKILAAAHAAVAQTPRARPKKTRWPAWIGVAASLSLAVGIAWQLRPIDKAAEAMSEEQAAMAAPASAAADSAAAASDAAAGNAAADTDAVMVPEAPVHAQAPPEPIADAAASVAEPTAELPPMPITAAPAPSALALPSPANERSRVSGGLATETVAPAPPPPPQPYSRSAERRDAQVLPQGIAPPAPLGAAADAPADAAPGAPAGLAREKSARIDARAAKSAATTATSGPAAAPASVFAPPAAAKPAPSSEAFGSRSAASASGLSDATEGFKARTQTQPAQEAKAEAESDATALDTVEVTGSRIGANEDDSRLPAAQWLDRIREYRDDGQTDRARDSLRKFRASYPHTRIPKDLRPLLK